MIFILRDRTVTEYLIEQLNRIAYGDGRFTYQVELKEYKPTRSKAQNNLYWLWLKAISDYEFEMNGRLVSDTQLHDIYRDAMLPTELVEYRGMVSKARKSTKKLKVKEFAEYLEKIDMYCAENLELILPHPEDYIYAMGIK